MSENYNGTQFLIGLWVKAVTTKERDIKFQITEARVDHGAVYVKGKDSIWYHGTFIIVAEQPQIDTVTRRPYRIMLTKGERDAIDWVGDRYSNGTKLYQLLTDATCQYFKADSNTETEWDSADDIVFLMPEHIAWQVKECIEEDGCACFSQSLSAKMYEFTNKIV